MVQVSQLAVPQAAPLIPRLDRIAYGGDYNPEQWPEEVWAEDVALMREAGVNLVSVGIFSWAMLEPRPGVFTFEWLDRLLDLLHTHGIAVDLATPTAAPPPWFLRAFPSARPMTVQGTPLGGGARQTFCPSSPEYASAAAAITTSLARRYAAHPAVVLWHAHNEYGGANGICYCPGSAAAFRTWLITKYRTLEALNAAWGTAFWSQRYSDWDEIEPPITAPTAVNPAQELDYYRFSSDAHLDNFRRERDILHTLSPGIPVTTNFMLANCKNIDYWTWAAEVDLVSNDHYLQAERPDNHIELSMCADLTRSVAGGAPWLLMEHSTGSVNWQPRNIAKKQGEMVRNSLAHLARGADGIMFFQWRASRYGAEKFHSAMLPHGGTDTQTWQDVVALGATLSTLSPLRGTPVAADVAMLWDWESWWALELPWRPSSELAFRERQEAFYEALWRRHLTVDFARASGSLAGYPMVIAPASYLLTTSDAANLREYVAGGGTLVVSYFSGIVDENDAVHPGPHPGALRDVLGLRVDEFLPLHADETVTLDSGLTGDLWAERVRLDGATVLASYLDGPAAGLPAITTHEYGAGRAIYVSTRLNGASLDAFVGALGLPARDLPAGLEVVRRGEYVVALNHTAAALTLPGSGVEVRSGDACVDGVVVPAGEVRVLHAHP